MSAGPQIKAKRPSDSGFALIVVLWIAALLSILTLTLSDSVRTHVRVAANLAESAKAEALAEAGVNLAIMDMLAAQQSRGHRERFPADGRPMHCAVADKGWLRIAVADEAGRIDLNRAGRPLMQALLAGLGEPPGKAARLSAAIFDYRDPDGDPIPNGAERDDYRAAGLGWAPKNGPLQSIEELGQVHGMTPGLVARMQPFVTVHSGLAGVDASLADRALVRILRNGLAKSAGSFGSFPAFHPTVALPAMFVAASPRRTFRVSVEAHTSSGATFVRTAIVDVGSRQSPHIKVLRWTRGTLTDDKAGHSQASQRSPAC